MDPLTMSLLGGAGGETGGALLGEVLGGGDRATQRRLIEEALAQLKGTNVEAGPSAYGTDQDYSGALAAMKQKYEQGGMSGADRLAQDQAMNDAARGARMRDEGITQNLSMRGQAGGGNELAARLASSQNATSAMYGAGAQQAGAAQARALESLKGWGSMAGQRDSAQDAISRFNASQRLGKATALLGGGMDAANYYGGEAARKQRLASGVGSGLGAGAGYYYGTPAKAT